MLLANQRKETYSINNLHQEVVPMAEKYIFRTVPDAPIKCEDCHGSGQVPKAGSRKDSQKCKNCHGSGRTNPMFSENSRLKRVRG